jgi:hypothetical protein
MSTIAQVIEQFQRAVQGGIAPDDSRLNDDDYLEAKIHEYRAKAISLTYTGAKNLGRNMSIDPACYTTPYPLTYELAIQDAGACYVKFRVPEVIQIASYLDGFGFLGDLGTFKNFSKLKSVAEIGVLKDIDPATIGGIYYGVIGTMAYIFGAPDLRQASISPILKNPMDAPNTIYNPVSDPYPIPDDMIPLLIELMKQEFGVISSTPQDLKSNENGNT